MKLPLPLLCLALIMPVSAQDDQRWQPAFAPVMTKWAQDVKPLAALPDYPRPQFVRKDWLCLNGLWQFENAGNASPLPRNRTLNERILVPFPVQSALSGISQKYKQVWYRKMFTVPEAWKNRQVLLHFGAVSYECGVYLNGKLIGTHKGSYDAFSFDITQRLQEGENELIVGAINSPSWADQVRGKQTNDPRSGQYLASSGIWQTVWLEPLPQARIDDIVITPDVDTSSLSVRTVAPNAEGDAVTIDVLDGANVVAQGRGIAGTTVRIPIPNPKLWTPDSPALYNLKINLVKANQVVDSVGSYAALRKISLGKDENGKTRILLNNAFIFQIGVLDPGQWPDGLYTAPTDDALKFDIEAAKKLGFNMIRKHAKIEPDRWYYWADKLGMLVWQDMPSGENKAISTKRQFENELRQMVTSLRNHPSIVMWVLFDEGRGQFDTERFVQMLRLEDPTRLVSNASGGEDKLVGDVHDTHSFPSPRSNPPEPMRAAVNGEFGNLAYYVSGHSWKDYFEAGDKMQERVDDPVALTRRYENLLRQAWKLKESPGASAVVFAQLTDVEGDVLGLYSYDRAVLKMEEANVRAANIGNPITTPLTMIAATAKDGPVDWKYTLKHPQEGWERPGYDELDWKTGPAPFGATDVATTPVRTEWKAREIWLRREVEIPAEVKNPTFLLLHDDDATIYINGILAAKVTGKNDDYEEIQLSPSGKAALQPGKNLIAVQMLQRDGNQIFDLGIGSY